MMVAYKGDLSVHEGSIQPATVEDKDEAITDS
jgi:hypothetical protein